MSYLNWNSIDWTHVSKVVVNLQCKIFEASRNNDVFTMFDLQNSLVSNIEAKLLSIRKVTQDNRGRKTPGVDNITYLRAPERMRLLDNIKIDGHASPITRVWIPKPGKKEKRPLGIPTIKDRVKQQLVKLALEPQWEAKFEPHSYGFRPGRNAMDAVQQLQKCLKTSERFILDADIRKCFDRINHEKLLEKTNCSRLITEQIRAWLKAGILDPEISSDPIENEKGTPQGGVISPLLSNIALHGLENFCLNRITEVRRNLANQGLIKIGPQIYCNKTYFHLIRYADDFVFIHPSIEVVRAYKKEISIFLQDIGLELNSEKTVIRSSLNTIKDEGKVIKPGLDFLGFHFRLVPSKTHPAKTGRGERLNAYLSVLPSFDSITDHLRSIRTIVDRCRGISQLKLIIILGPKINGFANYYRFIQSKKRFRYLDHNVFKILSLWCFRRHTKHSRKWCYQKYFQRHNRRSWVFTYETANGQFFRLPFYTTRTIERYHPVKDTFSPYDPKVIVNAQRLKLNVTRQKLFERQKGVCKWCLYQFTVNDTFEIHHTLPKGNPKREYLQYQWLIHGHCHDSLHADFENYPIYPSKSSE